MNSQYKPTFSDGYRYLWKETKGFWNRNGGKIMTAAGTAGLFLTGIHACRKTYKIHDELKENGERIRKARMYIDGESGVKRAGRIAKEKAKCTAKTAKRYLADAVAGTLSAYAVAKGWHREHRNYEQAAALVGIVMADFMNYRNNVISEQGKDADRRYMTTKQGKAFISEEKAQATSQAAAETGDEHIVQLEPSSLRIWYSRETTPQVWNDNLDLRICQLNDIRNHLDMDLIYGGSYTVNDVRRYFYGRKGDVGEGGMFGRIWDPGDPEHPERGARVNLHYEEDEDFMSGRVEGCWILIDIDPEPLFELMKKKHDREMNEKLGETIKK